MSLKPEKRCKVESESVQIEVFLDFSVLAHAMMDWSDKAFDEYLVESILVAPISTRECFGYQLLSVLGRRHV